MDTKTPTPEYLEFCGKVAKSLGKDWNKVGNQCKTVWEHLQHIPNPAWPQLANTAVKRWETWPINIYIAISELYGLWATENKFAREIKKCEYCNSAGTFSASKIVEVKPNVNIRYYFTYRCGGCENWRGLYGNKIKLGYPLEIKTHEGMTIHLNGSPIEGDYLGRKSLESIINTIGTRKNQKTKRPDFLPYKDDYEITF
jgi:hypothetical protein